MLRRGSPLVPFEVPWAVSRTGLAERVERGGHPELRGCRSEFGWGRARCEVHRGASALHRRGTAPIFRAGVHVAATAIGIPELYPHELRHTAASGADVKVVQQMLGHSSAAMTMDVYGHLFSDRLDEVADALDTARSEAARSEAAVANAQNPVAKVLPNADVVDLAAYKAKGKAAGQTAISDGAPGEIRTRAPASGGRCSIP